MRFAVVFMLGISGLIIVSAGGAQQTKQPPARYGIEADLDNYPQAEPKAALESVGPAGGAPEDWGGGAERHITAFET